MDRSPIRLSAARIRLYGIALVLICLAQIRLSGWDWSVFQTAGRLVGTPHLLDNGFMYAPGYAWLLAPTRFVSSEVGYWINTAILVVAIPLCALLAARIYKLNRSFAVLATVAWTPILYSIIDGQNAPLGLLLYLAAIWAYCERRWLPTGLAIGAMLYKPTYAMPLIVLLAFRRDWRVFIPVCISAIGWYVASATALDWNWIWPVAYARELTHYYAIDFATNAARGVSIQALLMRAGVPSVIAIASGGIVLIAGVLRLSKATPLAALSLIGALGVACSPHAWTYDCALILPALFYVMTTEPEPWRTRATIAAYLVGAGWLIEDAIRFNTVAIVAVAGAAYTILCSSSDR